MKGYPLGHGTRFITAAEKKDDKVYKNEVDRLQSQIHLAVYQKNEVCKVIKGTSHPPSNLQDV